MKAPDIRYYPGYSGAFTREQANVAIPNGSRIIKQNSDERDAQRDGSLGTILGSIETPDEIRRMGINHVYFVEWDDRPKIAVGLVDKKVRTA